jgi:hypothetical protein
MYRGSSVFWRNISPGFLLGLLFDTEDANSMFLQNVALSLTYTVTTQKIILFTVTAMTTPNPAG